MRTGKLDKRILVQKPILSNDNYGGKTVDNWQNVYSMFANIRPLKQTEQLIAAQAAQTITHMITIRYRIPFIESDWRIVYNDPRIGQRIFQVDSAEPLNSGNRYITVRVEERRP